MTEREGWALGAQLWSQAKMFEGASLRRPVPHIMVPGGKEQPPCFGLCQFLARLGQCRKIDESVFLKMRRRLDAFLKRRSWNGAYLYPLTAEGAQTRAAACSELEVESVSVSSSAY